MLSLKIISALNGRIMNLLAMNSGGSRCSVSRQLDRDIRNHRFAFSTVLLFSVSLEQIAFSFSKISQIAVPGVQFDGDCHSVLFATCFALITAIAFSFSSVHDANLKNCIFKSKMGRHSFILNQVDISLNKRNKV